MKDLIVLQALSSNQDQRKHLSISYDRIIGTRKGWNVYSNPLQGSVIKETVLIE